MLSTELRAAPVLTVPEITEGQYRYMDIDVRAQQIEVERRTATWERIGTIATAGLTTLALFAAVSAWIRTGRLQKPT